MYTIQRFGLRYHINRYSKQLQAYKWPPVFGYTHSPLRLYIPKSMKSLDFFVFFFRIDNIDGLGQSKTIFRQAHQSVFDSLFKKGVRYHFLPHSKPCKNLMSLWNINGSGCILNRSSLDNYGHDCKMSRLSGNWDHLIDTKLELLGLHKGLIYQVPKGLSRGNL